ncbi:hypothetical protein DPMN_121151 [Dreissena polymorpha]|uniref:Uncharacterized protein n=1 Tax=Dreissena polymorpha TaxID=45954 RepID=A0A9D4GPZ9_DREPO|nr:hypothetical protein DPMN_121151 [Dreissena polymorpha]
MAGHATQPTTDDGDNVGGHTTQPLVNEADKISRSSMGRQAIQPSGNSWDEGFRRSEAGHAMQVSIKNYQKIKTDNPT